MKTALKLKKMIVFLLWLNVIKKYALMIERLTGSIAYRADFHSCLHFLYERKML